MNSQTPDLSADLPDLGNGLNPDGVIARLTAMPGVQRLPNPKLTLFVKRDVLSPEVCQALIAQIDSVRRPSTIADANGDAAYRTSETGDLPADDPAVEETERRIAMLTGLSAVYGEPIQGQRYAVGQEFKQHTDYFEPKGFDYHRYCALSGNRTWTVMLYLNTPEAGGATRFKAVDKIIQPEPGKLVAWSNRRPDGSTNPATLHQAMKVRAGVKYVITKWYRELPWRG